jgi:hypothetical protein
MKIKQGNVTPSRPRWKLEEEVFTRQLTAMDRATSSAQHRCPYRGIDRIDTVNDIYIPVCRLFISTYLISVLLSGL